MRIMYHQTDQTLILYGLTRPSLGQCDFMRRLKLFLKKMSLSQLLFGRLSESKSNKKKKLLLFDDDGTNSRIKTPDADNRTFGLVNTDDDYPARAEFRAKCRTLIIYYNNKNNSYLNSENNVANNFKGNDYHPSQADYNSAPTGSKPDTATKRNAKDDTVIKSNKKNRNQQQW